MPCTQAAGELDFSRIYFAYPACPAVPVLHDFSLRAAAGKVTALVGASGSGKSTVVGLVERFYDVTSGAIYLDGMDVRQLSLPWLRRQVRVCIYLSILPGTQLRLDRARHSSCALCMLRERS